jgi:hypothetical protein
MKQIMSSQLAIGSTQSAWAASAAFRHLRSKKRPAAAAEVLTRASRQGTCRCAWAMKAAPWSGSPCAPSCWLGLRRAPPPRLAGVRVRAPGRAAHPLPRRRVPPPASAPLLGLLRVGPLAPSCRRPPPAVNKFDAFFRNSMDWD